MKKNYIYFVAPLVGLVVFSAVYWNYSAGYEARLAAVKKAEHDIAQAKLDKEAANRLKAATEAKQAQDDRKEQKRLKDLKDAEDADRHERAIQARNKAIREADRLVVQVKKLKKDITDEKKEIESIEEARKRSVAEQAFLAEYVKKSQENTKNLLTNLDKIADADKKWEDAAREAARAAKKQ